MRLWSSFTLGFTFLATEKTIGNVSSRVAWGHHADQIKLETTKFESKHWCFFGIHLPYVPTNHNVPHKQTLPTICTQLRPWLLGQCINNIFDPWSKVSKVQLKLATDPQNKAAFTVCKRNSIEMHAARKAVAQMRPSFWGFAVRLWLEPMAASTLNWIKRKETSLNRIM